MPPATCPHCSSAIPVESINIDEGVALCPSCGDLSRLRDIAPPLDSIPIADPHNAPPGCRVESDGITTTYTASARSSYGFWFMLFFTLFWNAITSVFVSDAVVSAMHHHGVPVPAWFPMHSSTPHMSPGMTIGVCIFMIPFVLIGIGTFLAAITLAIGSLRVAIDGTRAVALTGFGPFVTRKRFDTGVVTAIRITEYHRVRDPEYGPHECIQIEAHKTVKIGTILTEERRQWLASALLTHVFADR